MDIKNCLIVYACFVLNIVLCQNYVENSSMLQYKGPCSRSDPQLEKCLIRAFENVKFEFATGYWFPKLKLKQLDPFNLQNHIFGNDFVAKIVTENMTVSGLSNYKVEHYNVNLNTLTVDITMLFPKISDTGIYSGTINILGLAFNGTFRARYSNTRAFIHFELQKYLRNGIEYLRVFDVELSSDKKFDNLIASRKNHQKVFPIIYPYIERSYGLIIKDELNKVLELISLEQLLPR